MRPKKVAGAAFQQLMPGCFNVGIGRKLRVEVFIYTTTTSWLRRLSATAHDGREVNIRFRDRSTASYIVPYMRWVVVIFKVQALVSAGNMLP